MEHALPLGIAATVIEVVACRVLARVAPPTWSAVVSGSPLWGFYVGGFHQGVVFPVFAGIALYPVLLGELSLDAWLHSSFSDVPMPTGCVYFHLSLAVYWAKDCLAVKMPALIWFHHIICLLSVAASLSGSLPHAAGVFTIGAFALETGSLANTVSEVSREDSRHTVRRLVTPVMAASNVFSICLVLRHAWTFDGAGAATWWLAAAVGTTLCLVRQFEWNKALSAGEAARVQRSNGKEA